LTFRRVFLQLTTWSLSKPRQSLDAGVREATRSEWATSCGIAVHEGKKQPECDSSNTRKTAVRDTSCLFSATAAK
jgi:hypothetical protein